MLKLGKRLTCWLFDFVFYVVRFSIVGLQLVSSRSLCFFIIYSCCQYKIFLKVTPCMFFSFGLVLISCRAGKVSESLKAWFGSTTFLLFTLWLTLPICHSCYYFSDFSAYCMCSRTTLKWSNTVDWWWTASWKWNPTATLRRACGMPALHSRISSLSL